MPFETLKRSHLKRNIIIGIVIVTIISTLVLNFTKAKYRTAQSLPLINGTVNYTPYDFKMVAMYQENDNGEYESIDTVPTHGYLLNSEESYCEVDGEKDKSIIMSYQDGNVDISINKKGTKCYIYFKKLKGSNIQSILGNYNKMTRYDFNNVYTESTTKTLFMAEDNDGITYYFAGNPTDNWVSFAGFYWRIIRINGRGSIRLIYSGEATSDMVQDHNIVGNDTQIKTDNNVFVFNNLRWENAGVGYMYASGSVMGLETSSNVKTQLENWYQDNLRDYTSYLDINAGFCGDRTPSTEENYSNGLGGTGSTETYYGAYIRLLTNKNPTYLCNNISDLYTAKGADEGNGRLEYPVGLITADEVVYAGGVYRYYNTNYFLYNNQDYWTISPHSFSGPSYSKEAYMFGVFSNGIFDWGAVYLTLGIRPVINLRSDVTLTGSGTATDPYVVVTS